MGLGLGRELRFGFRFGSGLRQGRARSSSTPHLVLEGLGDACVGGGRLALPLATLRLERVKRAQPVEHRQGQRLCLAPVEELPLRHRRRGVVPAQLALDLVRLRVRLRARAARLGLGRDAANPKPGPFNLTLQLKVRWTLASRALRSSRWTKAASAARAGARSTLSPEPTSHSSPSSALIWAALRRSDVCVAVSSMVRLSSSWGASTTWLGFGLGLGLGPGLR